MTDGIITKVTAGAAPAAGDERHQLAIPGIASLHSHAFQRGMAGLAETRGNTADTFWTWRETMYRFALDMTPEDAEAVATLLYVEMLEQGFTRVGEFHYLHHDHDGTPYANPAEMATRIARAAEATGIGLTLLPSFYAHGYLWRRRATCRPAPLHLLGRPVRQADRRHTSWPSAHCPEPMSASRRTACGP